MLASGQLQFVSFKVDGSRHAVALSSVERVVHAAEVTRIPGAPPLLLGMIQLAGELVPVFSLRPRLDLPVREPHPGDQFLVVRTARRRLVLMVDAVEGVLRCDEAPVPVAEAASYVQGVLGIDDAEGPALMLIHDLEAFLSPAEEGWLLEHVERPP